MSKCPSCNSNYSKRSTRNFFQRIIPKSKVFKCFHCKTKVLRIPYLFSEFIIKKGKQLERGFQVTN